ASGHPTDIIVNVKPATTAVRPITPCTYVGKKLDKPIMIAPDVKVAIFAKATSLSCHNRSGIIGEKAFFSLHKKARSEEHTSELQSRFDLVCRLLLEKKNKKHEKITQSDT